MTVRFPKRTFGDKILSAFGKRRAVSFPTEGLGKYGSYFAVKEPFFRALLRRKGHGPPKGWFYPDEIVMIRANERSPQVSIYIYVRATKSTSGGDNYEVSFLT